MTTPFTTWWWIESSVCLVLSGFIFLGVVSLAGLYRDCAERKKKQRPFSKEEIRNMCHLMWKHEQLAKRAREQTYKDIGGK